MVPIGGKIIFARFSRSGPLKELEKLSDAARPTRDSLLNRLVRLWTDWPR